MDDTRSINALLRAHIIWTKDGATSQWRAIHCGEKCQLAMNNFPEEPLFTLRWRGQSVDFDDAPSGWSIPWE